MKSKTKLLFTLCPLLLALCALPRSDEAIAQRFGYGFGFGMHLQFFVDVAHVECDGRNLNTQSDRSRLVVVTFNK